MIIGISGKAGTGKDTVARMILYYTMDPILRNELGLNKNKNKILSMTNNAIDNICVKYPKYCPFKINKFANIPRLICAMVLEDNPFEEQFKQTIMPDEWQLPGEEPITGRDLLISVAEAIRKHAHPNFWANGLMSKYKPNMMNAIDYDIGLEPDSEIKEVSLFPNWIIPDVRMKSEVNAIINCEGKEKDHREIWRIERKGIPVIDVDGEKELDNYENFTGTIYNNKDIENLWNIVHVILAENPHISELIDNGR